MIRSFLLALNKQIFVQLFSPNNLTIRKKSQIPLIPLLLAVELQKYKHSLVDLEAYLHILVSNVLHLTQICKLVLPHRLYRQHYYHLIVDYLHLALFVVDFVVIVLFYVQFCHKNPERSLFVQKRYVFLPSLFFQNQFFFPQLGQLLSHSLNLHLNFLVLLLQPFNLVLLSLF